MFACKDWSAGEFVVLGTILKDQRRNMQNTVTIGIDIGGTKTAIGLVDTHGACLFEESFSTRAQESFDLFDARLAEKVNALLARFVHEYRLIGIGVAAPNANYFRGTIEAPSNFIWGRVEIVKLLSARFGVPVAITNDAKAAALGEMMYGEAKGMRDFMVVTLGTGLGSGIVVNGELLYGHDGHAGELGHTIIEPEGRACGCGRRGCLEMYVSSRGLCRTAFSLLSRRRTDSKLRDISFNELTAKRVYEAAVAGDALAQEAFAYTGKILGCALANAAAYFSPQAIIIFGGLANAGDLLLTPTQKNFEANLLNVYQGKIKIVLSGARKGSVAVLGASVLIQRELEKMHKSQ